MSMNPESRKRAVEVMAREQAKNSEFGGMSDEPEFWVHDCERMLDAILAADFHVAEWRKVEEAPKDGTHVIIMNYGCVEEGYHHCGFWPGWRSADGFNASPTMFMDLPEPPKEEGDGYKPYPL